MQPVVGQEGMDDSSRCIGPSATRPEDLMAYADGAAPPGVAEHVARCPSCSAQVAALALTQRWLQQVLYRLDCPSPQQLGDYELDLVAPETRTRIAQHVLDCPRCTAELAGLRAFLAVDDALLGAPDADLVGRSALDRLAGQLRRVVATLVAPPQPAYAGLRGAAPPDVLTYRAGAVTITLSIGRAARRDRVSLMGLVVREDTETDEGAGGLARLAGAGGDASTAEVDDLGNFVFESVPAGVYRLELDPADPAGEAVVIERLEL